MMAMMMGQSKNACVNTISSGTQLILNTNSRNQLKAQMVKTGLEAITNLMKGMMLRKQSAKIQSLIDGLPVPDPNLDKLSQTEEDLIASICQIAPEEQICKDFKNRSNGFYSSAVDMRPPGGAKTAKLNTDAGMQAAVRDVASDFGDSEGIGADVFDDASGEMGGEKAEVAKVKSTRKESATGGSADTSAELAVGAEGGEGEGEGGGDEESTAEGVAFEGGSEARSYSGPGFRGKSGGGQGGGSLDQIAGGDDSMGFGRAPASTKDIAPKTAEGLFKMISNRYENVSKDRLIKTQDDILR
jgi:hypothetical protein